MIAAARGDADASKAISEELALIYGLPVEGTTVDRLVSCKMPCCGSTSVFIWRAVLDGDRYPPEARYHLVGYTCLRVLKTWLARCSTPKRTRFGIDLLLYWLDWLPVHLAGMAYALLLPGEKARPSSPWDIHSSQVSIRFSRSWRNFLCRASRI